MRILYAVLSSAIVISITKGKQSKTEENPLLSLVGYCLDFSRPGDWWSYRWCFQSTLEQYHLNTETQQKEIVHKIGTYVQSESSSRRQTFKNNKNECLVDNADGPILRARSAQIDIYCCTDNTQSINGVQADGTPLPDLYAISLNEATSCKYDIVICYQKLCTESDISGQLYHSQQLGDNTVPIISTPQTVLTSSEASKEQSQTENQLSEKAKASSMTGPLLLSRFEQEEALDRVRNMFIFAYDAYMDSAAPEGELKPLSCTGGPFELAKIPLVTLIDTLDMLVIMRNFSEFRSAVSLVTATLPSFNLDVNVSVFETTIRVLGGLLSAHLFAIDPKLRIYEEVDTPYDGQLLELAVDIGTRLLPSFRTKTFIPYGTVNLRYGVPPGESEVASTAGAGSLLLEFQTLSVLTGDDRFGIAAAKALVGIYERRSPIGLVGKHIHVQNGRWFESVSGVGSNSDSFYEYILKAQLLFRKPVLGSMFSELYHAVKNHIQVGSWFMDVDMFSGQERRRRLESLAAFWPGLEASLGLVDSAANLLNAMHLVSIDQGFLPEEFDYEDWNVVKNGGQQAMYPLRPELIESTYHQYRATGDRSWLVAAEAILTNLEIHTSTDCGNAVIADVGTMQLEDNMPSFFLSETCKYLYLLFDEDNFVHDRPYIFSTEAHPFDATQLMQIENEREFRVNPFYISERRKESDRVMGLIEKRNKLVAKPSQPSQSTPKLANSCPKRQWWEQGASTYRPLPSLTGASSNMRENVAIMSGGGASSSSKRGDGSKDKREVPNPRDVCYASEGPAKSTSLRNARAASKSVEVDIQNLGKFNVQVYVDGFVVKSATYGDSVEIFGIGLQVVLVRGVDQSSALYHSNPPSRIVMSTVDRVIECSLRFVLEEPGGERITEDSLHGKNGPKFAKLREAMQNKYCSIAAFGATADLTTLSTIEVEGELAVAADGTGCEAPVVAKSPKRSSSWWSLWRGSGTDTADAPTTPTPPRPYEGKIVLVARGKCMFEEKAIIAQQAGAVAVVVANDEDFVFIMAGKKAAEGTATPKKTTTASPAANPPVTIPTVMISVADFNMLTEATLVASQSIKESLAKQSRKKRRGESGEGAAVDKGEQDRLGKEERKTTKGTEESATFRTPSTTPLSNNEKDSDSLKVKLPRINLTIKTVSHALDGIEFGHQEYPKVRLEEKMISVLGSGYWGAMMMLAASSENGAELEWQLYIHHRSVLEPFALTASSHALEGYLDDAHKVPVNIAPLYINPTLAYLSILRKQCPEYFHNLML